MTAYEHPQLPFGAEIDDEGIWCQVLNRVENRHPRPVLFLDRDGVVVEEVHYLSRPEDVRLVEGAAEVVALANSKSIPVVLVTNQAGIGYGKFHWQDFIDVQETILNELDEHGAYLNAVYACPFHATGQVPYQHPDHPCRKPNPGMLTKASDRIPVDKSRSWIVGDRKGDLEAGKRFGLAGGVHVLTGHGEKPEEQSTALSLHDELYVVHQAKSIRNLPDFLDILRD